MHEQRREDLILSIEEYFVVDAIKNGNSFILMELKDRRRVEQNPFGNTEN